MFKWTISKLIERTERVLMQNNVIDIEEQYFTDIQEDLDNSTLMPKIVAKYKDFSRKRRPISCLCFEPTKVNSISSFIFNQLSWLKYKFALEYWSFGWLLHLWVSWHVQWSQHTILCVWYRAHQQTSENFKQSKSRDISWLQWKNTRLSRRWMLQWSNLLVGHKNWIRSY